MSAVRLWVSRVFGIIRKRGATDFGEELQEHIDLLTADYISRGMRETEARAAARRELGNVTSVQEQYHEQNGIPLLENIWSDLRVAVRTLRRNRSYGLSCIGALAVGLGSMITILCAVSSILWTPLPYPSPERLVVLREVDPRGGGWTLSEPDFLDLQARSKSLDAIAAYRRESVALTGLGEPQTIRAVAATPSAFDVFGMRPILGRVIPADQNSVVIDRRFWQQKLQGRAAAIGRAIALDGESYTIAAVADLPADAFPGAEVLFPLAPRATESRSARDMEVVGRLRPGMDERPAQAELNAVAASIARENPGTNAGWTLRAVPLFDAILGPKTSRMIWMIFAAVALFWLLACMNVAGLQMARNIARRHEISTRLVLGATRTRLFGQLLAESLVVSAAGCAAGLVFAYFAVRLIRTLFAGTLPRLATLQLTPRTLGLALGCMLAATIVATLLSSREAKFQGGREIARRESGRDLLIVMQVALASILVLGASLFLRSFARLQAVDPGFNPEEILMVEVNVPTARWKPAQRANFFRDVTERIGQLPGVISAAATNVAPFSGHGTANRFRLDGAAENAEYRSAAWRAVTPDFFHTLGIPLKRGRLFSSSDVDGSQEVVIVSESMAEQFWPNQDPVGQRLLWGKSGSPKTIVGVVGDLRDLAVDAAPVPTMFRPFSQLSDAPMTLVIRTKAEPGTAIQDVRREIAAMDPSAAMEFRPLRGVMSDSIFRPRITLTAFAAFAAIGMLTAAFGLYALISYRVNQRQQEIGIRLALGCPAKSVRWSVQRRCFVLVAAGLAIGLPPAYGLSKLMQSLLYETRASDGIAYGAVLAVFVVVAFAASYSPARRASKMDPAAAIRHE